MEGSSAATSATEITTQVQSVARLRCLRPSSLAPGHTERPYTSPVPLRGSGVWIPSLSVTQPTLTVRGTETRPTQTTQTPSLVGVTRSAPGPVSVTGATSVVTGLIHGLTPPVVGTPESRPVEEAPRLSGPSESDAPGRTHAGPVGPVQSRRPLGPMSGAGGGTGVTVGWSRPVETLGKVVDTVVSEFVEGTPTVTGSWTGTGTIESIRLNVETRPFT